MGGWTMDLRHALRAFAREPRFAVFVVASVALGIGSNAAIYGVADKLFLRGPTHVAAPAELARVFLAVPGREGEDERMTPWIPYQTALALQEDVSAFADLTLFRFQDLVGRVGQDVRPLRVSEVDGHYFATLGVPPRMGRFFDSDAGTAAQNGVVISYGLWLAAFGGSPAALGSSVNLGGTDHIVVAVAPEGFSGPRLDRVDAWLALDARTAASRNWHLVGRLTPGSMGVVGLARVEAEANAVHRRTPPGRFFRWAEPATVQIRSLASDDMGEPSAEASVAGLLLGVVSLVLLITGANVVNLLLARVTRRRGEMMVRLALGVGRWRLTRLLLTESVTLALLGGAVSIPVAHLGALALRGVLLPQVAWTEAPLDLGLLGLTGAVALVVGVGVGLLPVRYAARSDLRGGVAADRVGRTRRGGRAQDVLVTAQITLTAALLMCAGLFLKSFWTMRVTDLGFDAGEVLAVSFRPLDEDALPQGSEAELEAYQQALRSAVDVPGVEHAALTVGLPFMYNFGWSVHLPGSDSIPEFPGGGPYVSAVTGAYFRTMGTPILRGSPITDDDVARQRFVVVVSESMARTLWPGGDALGECLHLGSPDRPCSSVVGVAGDVHRMGYREPPSMQYYVPLGLEGGFGGMALVVRPSDAGAAGRLRAALAENASLVQHVDVVRLRSLLDAETRPWRLGAVVLTLASLLALVVSVIGVYGVLSYVVAQRRREIGVRIALGASGSSIRRLILQGGLRAGGVGVAGGIALVLIASGRLQPLLFETSVADPFIMVGVGALLMGAAALACLMPATQAARTHPVTCLKGEG